ncbi:K homology domain, prokaryotic type [Artemisia annua]|uniref:K homology domain, prokaryotic type n=1 Tax=Artemisia annua TaxID=35608 RepID=A0A2U1MIM6_ARTAN|nr:K homology domain, prokaryotic type [Artemisia annua]
MNNQQKYYQLAGQTDNSQPDKTVAINSQLSTSSQEGVLGIKVKIMLDRDPSFVIFFIVPTTKCRRDHFVARRSPDSCSDPHKEFDEYKPPIVEEPLPAPMPVPV